MAGGLALGLVAAATPASAINCREWSRLDIPQKEAAIDGMIADMLQGQRVRQYDVQRGALGRCLSEQAYRMELAFDDACSDSRTADMQAIQRIFKTYVWSCS
jgi:hypothetical protein